MNILRRNKAKSGLSLIELVTVLAILLVLSVFALPAMEVTFVRSREKLLHERLTLIRKAIDNYAAVRNGNGTSVFPPCLASLTETIPATLLIAEANSGPFIDAESLGNPFAPGGDTPYWDIRDKDGNVFTNVTDARQAIEVYDVSFPAAGVGMGNEIATWSKASDDTFYKDW